MDLALGVTQGVMESPGPAAHLYLLLEASHPHPSSMMVSKFHPYKQSHPKKGKTSHTQPQEAAQQVKPEQKAPLMAVLRSAIHSPTSEL